MKEKMKKWAMLCVPLAAAIVLMIFLHAVNRLEDGRYAEGKAELEDTLRRTAAACYAAEGIYPPDLDYLAEHYGIQVEEESYIVFYEIFADNLMPNITVLEKGA